MAQESLLVLAILQPSNLQRHIINGEHRFQTKTHLLLIEKQATIRLLRTKVKGEQVMVS
jgi:hypothetical protein